VKVVVLDIIFLNLVVLKFEQEQLGLGILKWKLKNKMSCKTEERKRVQPVEEGPKANPRRVAMENYGAQLDVHDLLYRFMTDLLCAQPNGFFSSLGNLNFY
jgi:hypothetical protein